MARYRFIGSFIFSGLVFGFSVIAQADDYQSEQQQQFQQQQIMQQGYQQQGAQSSHPKTYSRKVQDKALYGLTNVATAGAEIPKAVINLANTDDTNVVYAIIGGTIEGMLYAAERGAVGLMDLITAPIPTEPNIYPQRVWEDFDRTTTYGKVFRLDDGKPKQTTLDPNNPGQR